ncbi:hypothetical protein [Borrelia sp. RT5S]|uniref:hypothetical protein n=1 Tax=Borrelia sp. RT5S TaxID=2898581 RepID=UPI001E2E014F|nr:hypothetical protein [Borrelia sp. RT5S]UGQ16742.1 hypothetical protein LSO06_05325 [Borrelia sp. RT5S]
MSDIKVQVLAREAIEMIYKTEYSSKYSNETVLDMYRYKYGMSKGFVGECIAKFFKFIKDNHKEYFGIIIDYFVWYDRLQDDDEKQYLDSIEEKGKLGEDEFYGINFAYDYLSKVYFLHSRPRRFKEENRQEYHTDILLYNGAIASALGLPFDASSNECFIQVYKDTFNFFKTKYYRLKEISEVSKLLKLDKTKNASLLKKRYM